LISAFGRADANLLTFDDERWHLHHQAGFNLRGFGYVRDAGTLNARLGLDHRHIHGGRQFHADGFAFVEFHFYAKLWNQVADGVA